MKKISNYYIWVFTLYLSLLFGLLIGEDLLGGALFDYEKHLVKINLLRSDLVYYFLNYGELNFRHSPIFPVFHAIFLNVTNTDIFFRIANLHLNLLIILIFFLTLNLKFKKTSKKNLLIISSIILIMPTFRSYSIWPDSFLCGFIFFMFSIYYIIKFIDCASKKKLYYAYLNIIFLCIASYVSPNFSTFSIFYLYIFYKYFNFSKSILKIISLNFIISLPMLFYIFILGNNFLDFDGSHWIKDQTTISLHNIANKIILLPTIFIIYFIPFFILKFSEIKKKFFLIVKNFNYIHYAIIASPIMLIKYFSYYEINMVLGGGGLIFTILQFFDNHLLILTLISSVSIFTIMLLLENNKKNIIFIFCLFLSAPQLTIYTVYFDLILFICIFLFMNEGLLKIDNLLNKNKNIILFFIYYLSIFSLYTVKRDFLTFMISN